MSLPSETVSPDSPPVAPSPPGRRRVSFFAKDRPWINIVLFVLTLGSAFLVGTSWGLNYLYAEQFAADPNFQPEAGFFQDSRLILLSAVYAIVLMAILLAHELGHYLTCRRYGLSATLPFFIPAPTLIGTLGAFIKIRSPVNLKHRLFDIGAAGPLAGFVLAVPALLAGLAMSKIVPAIPHEEAIVFGEPLLLSLGGHLFLKGAGPGMDIILHPVAFAGWVGVLVTALNLLPLGQLDGGHICYAVFGSRNRLISKIVMGILVVFGLLFWIGWLIWFFLLLIMGLRHPRVFDENEPLGKKRTIVAFVILLIFILSFIPAPVRGYNIVQAVRSIWP
jgi:membrane-associated protease RseP (regulator of RpoE activity)